MFNLNKSFGVVRVKATFFKGSLIIYWDGYKKLIRENIFPRISHFPLVHLFNPSFFEFLPFFH